MGASDPTGPDDRPGPASLPARWSWPKILAVWSGAFVALSVLWWVFHGGDVVMVVRQTLFITGVAAVAGFGIRLGNNETRKDIERRQQTKQRLLVTAAWTPERHLLSTASRSRRRELRRRLRSRAVRHAAFRLVTLPFVLLISAWRVMAGVGLLLALGSQLLPDIVVGVLAAGLVVGVMVFFMSRILRGAFGSPRVVMGTVEYARQAPAPTVVTGPEHAAEQGADKSVADTAFPVEMRVAGALALRSDGSLGQIELDRGEQGPGAILYATRDAVRDRLSDNEAVVLLCDANQRILCRLWDLWPSGPLPIQKQTRPEPSELRDSAPGA